MTTPAIAALRRRFPAAHLAYLVEPPAVPVVQHNPHLDEVIVAPRRRGIGGWLADMSTGARLRRERFDIAIDFHGGPRASLLTWLSRAPVRIGYAVTARSWMYTHVVERARELRRRHSVESQWDLLDSLDIPRPTPAANPIHMPIDAAARQAIDARLAGANVGAHEDVAVLHVGASSPFRRWPLSSFAETVAALAHEPARRIIVTSGPSEGRAARDVAETVWSRLPEAIRPRVLEWSDLSLAELRALVERAALFIGGDSGPLHIASAGNVPIVAIFGPTPSERSLPWRHPDIPAELMEINDLSCRPCDQRVCLPGDFRCLTHIDPDRVVAAAERLLARRGSARGSM